VRVVQADLRADEPPDARQPADELRQARQQAPRARQVHSATVTGYCRVPGEQPRNDLSPVFETAVKRRPGKVNQIKAKRPEIRRVIRRDRLQLSSFPDLMTFQRMLKSMGLAGRKPASLDNVQFQHSVDLTPTEKELDSIIAKWEESHDAKWDDVGFEFRGTQTPTLWLSKATVRERVIMDVQRANPHFVDGASLLGQLVAKRKTLLAAATIGE
jgi:hypothetical protein